MGDFKGHALPGSLFLLFGLWCAVCCLRRYLTCRRAGTKYVSTAYFTCPCACGPIKNWPMESMVKIVLSALGMFTEIILNLPHPNMGIIQHATMYFFFLMSGVVDLMMHFGVPLPPGSDYIGVLLAFTVEGLLFVNHLHGRPVVDVQIHVLLVYVIFLTVLVLLLESKFQRSPILTMCRAYLLMLQGSWFWGVGVILYGHGNDVTAWDLNKEMDAMQATIYFSWHCAVHFIILVVATAVASFCYRIPSDIIKKNGSGLPLTRLDNGSLEEGYRMLTHQDEDSDIEYEKPVASSTSPPVS